MTVPQSSGETGQQMAVPKKRLQKELYFAVFNRWGQRVFETQSPTSEGWDGTINGTPFI
jgi:hypothetical protein